MPAGRPSDYTVEKADLICERIAGGESLRSICTSEDMPSVRSVFRWLENYPEFVTKYVRAREAQADALFDEMLDIADDGRNDWMAKLGDAGETMGWRENGEALRRSDLRIKTRQWIAAKLRPKVYGEKSSFELTGKDGGAIETTDTTDPQKLARAVALLLAEGSKG